MGRLLDTATLDGAAKYYAGQFLLDAGERNRSWVMGQFYNFTYKDEFEYLINAIKGQLGGTAVGDFEQRAANAFTPREEKVFHALLADKLAVDPDGEHIPGRIGSVDLGARVVGKRVKFVTGPSGRIYQLTKNVYWPIYAGEAEERIADSGVADPLPEGTEGLPLGATNPAISNECAILALDAIVDNFDEGTGAAVIQGRSGAQPADVDTAVSGTLLFTLTCTDPAFGAAADDTGKATATAAAITDDTTADATNTLGYCRLSATSDGVTPIDDHLDGEAGTSASDYNFNTLAIVAGATVSMTSLTVSLPET